MLINATNIGQNLTGLGKYSLYLVKFLLNNKQMDAPDNGEIKIYINTNASVHFNRNELKKLHLISKYVSPDYGLKGHLLRLLWTQTITEPVFNLSQLEPCLFNKNQIITVHDLIPLNFPEQYKKQFYFFKYLLPFALKKTKKIITVSENSKKELIYFYHLDKRKIETIYNGVEQDNTRLLEQQQIHKSNYILFVGRDSEHKNIKRLIEAFVLLKVKYKIKEKLKIVGIAKALVAHESIEYLSYVDNPSLINLYKKAKIFVFPSLYEGFGYPPLEAMLYGTPVITSNNSSLPEVCQDAALYVDPYDVQDIANKIYYLLNNKNEQEKLIQAGFKNIKKFTLQKSLEKHLKIIQPK